jgi:hypothetical protein
MARQLTDGGAGEADDPASVSGPIRDTSNHSGFNVSMIP